MLDRRQLLTGLAGGLLGGLTLPRPGLAQQPGIVPLTSRLSLLTTERDNRLALNGPDGLVLVDSGAPELTDSLMASLRPLGRVSTLFNTHFHPEHTGGNEAMRQAGATVIAHENTRLWMATPTWLPAEDRYRPARPKVHPTNVLHRWSLQADGERIDYEYLIEAHTSSDIYVFFREANVLAVGDIASPARDHSSTI
jgi:glyoxylase-like metal-dependent hydrolase (beta-lactamase superfamily II)